MVVCGEIFAQYMGKAFMLFFEESESKCVIEDA